MDKLKIILSTIAIFLLSFLIAFFALQFAKQTGRDDFFRAARPYELVVKNARIIDGSGQDIFDSHIGIKDGRIITVSSGLVRGNADIMDATGFTLIPSMVEIPEETDWVTRDLPGAMARFPYYRIFFKQSDDPTLAGRSLEAVLLDGIYNEEELLSRFTWSVLIAPDGEPITGDDLVSAVYKLTGWRAFSLDVDTGVIAPGYQIQAYLYRTRNINQIDFIDSLRREVYPPADFILSGNDIIDGKSGRIITIINWPDIIAAIVEQENLHNQVESSEDITEEPDTNNDQPDDQQEPAEDSPEENP